MPSKRQTRQLTPRAAKAKTKSKNKKPNPPAAPHKKQTGPGPAKNTRTSPARATSPCGDIHRNFKPEPHIGISRGSPLHVRPPLANEENKNGGPIAKERLHARTQHIHSPRPMLLMQLSYQLQPDGKGRAVYAPYCSGTAAKCSTSR